MPKFVSDENLEYFAALLAELYPTKNYIANTYAKKTESADYLQAVYSDSTLTLKLLASRSISLSIQKIEGIASVDYVNNAINNAITTALGGDY